jgi:hypothetical protein
MHWGILERLDGRLVYESRATPLEKLRQRGVDLVIGSVHASLPRRTT